MTRRTWLYSLLIALGSLTLPTRVHAQAHPRARKASLAFPLTFPFTFGDK